MNLVLVQEHQCESGMWVCLRVTGSCFGCEEVCFPPQLHIPHTDLQNKSRDNSGDCRGKKRGGEAVKPLTCIALRTIMVLLILNALLWLECSTLMVTKAAGCKRSGKKTS